MCGRAREGGEVYQKDTGARTLEGKRTSQRKAPKALEAATGRRELPEGVV